MHIANNDLGTTNYPCVPGHELAGIVTKVGSKVEKVKVGDHVGVGCIVDACLKCQSCKDGEENYCENGHTMTYDTKITHGHLKTNSGYTFGGYSQKMTIMEDFIIKVYVLKLHCMTAIWYSSGTILHFLPDSNRVPPGGCRANPVCWSHHVLSS